MRHSPFYSSLSSLSYWTAAISLVYGPSSRSHTHTGRELFPGSDLLKVKDRVPVIAREIVHYDPDIACLQEMDRLEVHNRVFSAAGYSTHSFTGALPSVGRD